MNKFKHIVILVCLALSCINSRAQWSEWRINYENGVPVSIEPEVFFDGRPTPFLTYYQPRDNHYAVKGRILNKHTFLKINNDQVPYLYSIELEVLNDFGKGLPKTILLVPDTCGGSFTKDFDMDTRVDYMIQHADQNEDTGFFFFSRNKAGQFCYYETLCIRDHRVDEYLTRWDRLPTVIKKKGMPVSRFERKLKRIIH